MPRQTRNTSKRKSESDTAGGASKKSKTKNVDHGEDGDRTPSNVAGERTDPEAIASSIVGGLKGGYRITGEGSATSRYHTFQVPYKDRRIICERRDAPDTSPERGRKGPPALIFTHGAGGGLENPATMHFAVGFAASRPVVTFQGTMNLKSRIDTFHTVVRHQRQGKGLAAAAAAAALGGRSMGARAAVIAANEINAAGSGSGNAVGGKVEALILVSYPLVAEKSGERRDQVLKEIDRDVSVLFVIGGEDKSCDIAELEEVREAMESKSWLCVVDGADHSMRVKKTKGGGEEGLQQVRMKTGEIAAQWLGQRDEKKTEYHLRWQEEKGLFHGEWHTRR